MTPRPAGYRWPLLTAIVAVVMLCAAVGFTLTHERVTVRPIAAAAAMPRGSSVGWLGCNRVARRPGRPIVVRNPAVTSMRRATEIRS